MWNFLFIPPHPLHKNLGLFTIFPHPVDVYLHRCLRTAKTSILLAQGMNHSAAFHTPALCGFARRAIATETAAKPSRAVVKTFIHILTQVSVFSTLKTSASSTSPFYPPPSPRLTYPVHRCNILSLPAECDAAPNGSERGFQAVSLAVI